MQTLIIYSAEVYIPGNHGPKTFMVGPEIRSISKSNGGVVIEYKASGVVREYMNMPAKLHYR